MTVPGTTLSRAHRSAIGAAHLGITLSEYQAHIEAGLRHCYDCKQWWPVGSMTKRSSKREGIDNICRSCSRARARIGIARRRAAQRED